MVLHLSSVYLHVQRAKQPTLPTGSQEVRHTYLMASQSYLMPHASDGLPVVPDALLVRWCKYWRSCISTGISSTTPHISPPRFAEQRWGDVPECSLAQVLGETLRSVEHISSNDVHIDMDNIDRCTIPYFSILRHATPQSSMYKLHPLPCSP